MTDEVDRQFLLDAVHWAGRVIAVLAVVVHEGRLILVRRAHAPDEGLWGFPGAKLEPGESMEEAAVRGLREETGVDALALRIVGALDAMDREESAVAHHYILVAVLCQWLRGEPVVADDVTQARWFGLEEVLSSTTEQSLSVNVIAAQAFGES